MSAIGCGLVTVFSTCPPSSNVSREAYLQTTVEVARWSEQVGCDGILVYSDNSLVDPWLVSQIILMQTERISPLVAIQPVYMHPYTTAKKIATCAYLHGRRLFLNMIAGGFRNDLVALNDPTPHDERYERLTEYTLVVRKLLEQTGPVSFEGKHYTIANLKMSPPLPPELMPGILSSGSSKASMIAARAMGSIPVKYPAPPGEEEDFGAAHPEGVGIRIGIVARSTRDEAWNVARARFPEDRAGQITHALAMKVSDSVWHEQLSGHGDDKNEGTYWLGPFRTYRTFCPYLVGSYAEVAAFLRRYVRAGCHTVILDVPASREELDHIRNVFRMALVEEEQGP